MVEKKIDVASKVKCRNVLTELAGEAWSAEAGPPDFITLGCPLGVALLTVCGSNRTATCNMQKRTLFSDVGEENWGGVL